MKRECFKWRSKRYIEFGNMITVAAELWKIQGVTKSLKFNCLEIRLIV